MNLEIQVVVRMYVATVLEFLELLDSSLTIYMKSVDAGIEYLIRIFAT